LGLQKVKVDRFRCLDSIEFQPDERINLIFGENGSGKTSILEAIFFLGRGRSFRPGQSGTLIQKGSDDFVVFGEVLDGAEQHRLGVQVARGERKVQVDGQVGQTASLAAAFPVQIIDPEVHRLVQGGPDGRRHFLDWGVFHVKHDFFDAWRRYRRALRQRNMALRQGAQRNAVDVWDNELVQSGLSVDRYRREFLEEFHPVFTRICGDLLGMSGNWRFLSGWPAEESFSDSLCRSRDQDSRHGSTHVGPHRAELVLEIDGQAARHRLSRGQQKLLSTSLVLAQSEFVATAMRKTVALLVDEPAAELDHRHLEQLMTVLEKPGIQLFLTALEESALPLRGSPRVFHVKQGAVSCLL
jgi:DNA replication and repair protein RecF